LVGAQELNAELEDSHAKAKELGEDLHKAQESLAGAFYLAHTRTHAHPHTTRNTRDTRNPRNIVWRTHDALSFPILPEREHQLVSLQKDKEVELQGLHDTLILMRNEAQVSLTSPSVQCACVCRVSCVSCVCRVCRALSSATCCVAVPILTRLALCLGDGSGERQAQGRNR
jgi:hypothetical protein